MKLITTLLNWSLARSYSAPFSVSQTVEIDGGTNLVVSVPTKNAQVLSGVSETPGLLFGYLNLPQGEQVQISGLDPVMIEASIGFAVTNAPELIHEKVLYFSVTQESGGLRFTAIVDVDTDENLSFVSRGSDRQRVAASGPDREFSIIQAISPDWGVLDGGHCYHRLRLVQERVLDIDLPAGNSDYSELVGKLIGSQLNA